MFLSSESQQLKLNTNHSELADSEDGAGSERQDLHIFMISMNPLVIILNSLRILFIRVQESISKKSVISSCRVLSLTSVFDQDFAVFFSDSFYQEAQTEQIMTHTRKCVTNKANLYQIIAPPADL